MKSNGALTKILIFAVFFLVSLGVLALASGLFNTASEYYNGNLSLSTASGAYSASGTTVSPYASCEYHTENTNPSEQTCPYYYYNHECPYDTAPPEYILIEMTPYDIFRGNLILVNKEHGFDPEFVPELVYVIDHVTPAFRVSRNDIQLAESIIEPLVQMMDAYYVAIGTNAVSVRSGFRSLSRQMEILNDHISRMGAAEARRWAAEPGHSEHHAGLALDFGFYQDGDLQTFLGVGRTAWFAQNSYNFGFIVRYPYEGQHITQVAYEPWHFRYVGLPHSYFINQKGMVFEDYLYFLMGFDYSEPFVATFGDYEYEIFFTKDMTISVPYGSYFDISGNNINGFIVTIRR